MIELNSGDVVILRGGWVPMTVVDVSSVDGVMAARCAWHDQLAHLHSEIFRVESLELRDPAVEELRRLRERHATTAAKSAELNGRGAE